MNGEKTTPSDGFGTVYDYAMFYISNGLSVIPIKPRDKVPLIKWENYQREPPSIVEVRKWFDGTDNNIAIVCGKVSGNLVVVDFDDVELYEEFLKGLDGELKDIVENTWLVKTGKGYHVYLRVNSDKPIRTRRFGKIDIKGEEGYVVAPPSIHPSGKRYDFVRFSKTTGHEIRVVSEDQYNKLLVLLEKLSKAKSEAENDSGKTQPVTETTNAEAGNVEPQANPEAGQWKDLPNNKILEITKALEPVYKPGLRHDIILFLVGWLYKAGVRYESAETVIKTICETYHDEECNDRLYTLRDTYGIGRPLREKVLKEQGKPFRTKDGLFTVLINNGVDEETAVTVIRKLEEILETPEPGVSVLIEKMDYTGDDFVVVNFRKCEVVTASKVRLRDNEEKLVFEDRIILGCPESLAVVLTPYSQVIKFDVVWNIPLQKRKLNLENVTVDELLAFLKANGLILRKNKAEDVLNAVLHAMMRKGLAEFRTGFDAPGFYWVDGKLLANKVEVRKPDSQELKEALELLNELANVWFANVKEQFLTALKLGLIMPFSFAIKQKFRGEKGFLPWLYLYGQRDTGKTTTAEIILHIFNIMNRQHELGVGEVNTEAKLGAVLSADTFPHIINEGASLFDKPNLNEIIKQAVEGVIARQRFESKSIIKEYPAYAPLIITANEFRVTDEALSQKRLVVLRYPMSAKVSKEKIAEFREKVANRLPKLKALGQFVEWYLLEHPDELTYDWLNLSKKILEKAYEFAGLTPTFDLGIQYVETDEADPRLDIVAVLWAKVAEAYNKRIMVVNGNDGVTPAVGPSTILEIVLDTRVVDFMIKKDDEVLFTSKVLQILRDEGINIDSMNAFAEIFADYNFVYERKKVMGKTMRVLSTRFEDLVRLFNDFFGTGITDVTPR
jgi:hypothetical protein